MALERRALTIRNVKHRDVSRVDADATTLPVILFKEKRRIQTASLINCVSLGGASSRRILAMLQSKRRVPLTTSAKPRVQTGIAITWRERRVGVFVRDEK